MQGYGSVHGSRFAGTSFTIVGSEVRAGLSYPRDKTTLCPSRSAVFKMLCHTAREKYTEVARQRRCGPVLGLDRHFPTKSEMFCLRTEFYTIVVLEASTILTGSSQHSESNPFSILLHYTRY